MSRSKVVRILIAGILGVFALCLLASLAGRFLLIDNPERSDIILVPDGGSGDVRFEHALKLFRSGYAPDLMLDAPNMVHYGRRVPEFAEEYVKIVAPDQAEHVHVCSFNGDSTFEELKYDARCLQEFAPHAKSVIIVTSNYHTRRALSIARRALPQYRWSVASAPDNDFEIAWWRKRAWAKETLGEWQRLIWWELIDQWRAPR